jgi:hypothetical protein
MLLSSVAAILALTWFAPARGRGQEAATNDGSATGEVEHAFLGVERCEDCHKEPSTTRIDRGVTDFVALTESKIWLKDVHSLAYALVDPATSELSKQICDKLQIDDISQAQRCLSCHSSWIKGRERPPTYDRGVACESCHGPSADWDVPHSREDWRAKTVTEKESLGMIDVRNPIKRAEQCLSCHIGNAATGKVVTHQMYAAGHPPLPSIEIESFAKQMPPHWRYLNEKPEFKLRDEFIRENNPYLLPVGDGDANQLAEHNHGAAAVVLGGVVALRESIELLGDMTSSNEQTWPELSVLNCSACHHDLAYPGWRQQNPGSAQPGRPAMHAWPTALVRLAVLHISPDRASYDAKLAEFNNQLAPIQTAFETTPFGKATELRLACSDLSDWLTEQLITPVSEKPFANRSLQRSLKLLVHIGSSELHDYDSARQIASALRTLYCELKTKPRQDEQVRALLIELAETLRLNLPNGQSELCVPQTIQDRELAALADGLSDALARSVEYDPKLFRSRMQSVQRLLSEG